MAVTINYNNGVVDASYSNVKETFPVSVAKNTSLEGEVLTTDTLVAGTGYTTITSAPISGGTGTGLVVNITAVAGGVTVVTVVDGGVGYTVGDTITLTGGGADATFDVATATENLISVLGLDVNGTYSKFTEEFAEGDYIWITDTDELRRIDNIVSDGKMTLSYSATTDASTSYKQVKNIGFGSVGIVVDALGAVEINGITRFANVSETFKTNDVFIPILIDTTSNANVVILTAKS